MLSDEEKDNVFKISVPIITNEELERFNNYLETDLDKIVNEISTHISRDREITLLKKVIEKQSKEIEELKEKDDANLAYYGQIYQNGIYTGQKAVEDKIKAKIEEYDEILYYAETEEGMAELKDYEYDEAKYGKKVLQSLLEKE